MIHVQCHVCMMGIIVNCYFIQQPNIKYFVRIIPIKKSDAQTFEWHGVHHVFNSPTTLKLKLMDTYKEKLPSTPDSINIGYLAKRGGKRGIENELDLTSMYKQFDSGESITLYCEAKSTSTGSDARRKRKSPAESESDVEDHETEVKKAADKLKEMHGEEKYDSRQLMLWGRMIVNKQWKSYDEPPDVPLITGGARKVPRRESLSEAITGAALAFAKAFSSPQQSSAQVAAKAPAPVHSGVSPMSKARLSSEYITQLKLLQELRDSGVLSDEEFLEQKSFALDNIRTMNTRK